jgi:hypothetical protein
MNPAVLQADSLEHAISSRLENEPNAPSAIVQQALGECIAEVAYKL